MKTFLPIKLIQVNDFATANRHVHLSTEHGHTAKVVIAAHQIISMRPEQVSRLLNPAIDYLSRCEME